uniref:TBC1 domain family member 25-like n=1 Tax=Phallusia mammillata TaxID=59560 RepID=A0A6F9DV34_9ASCI|nr:TBC1 domain family member 25-like [Phallusia mammillata]
MFKVTRSSDIKDVIHIKVKKFAGYFNPESKSFAVDPHLTTFDDLQKILVEAFNLNGPFHITYLCRDDVGENVFLSMLTDWDLDAAFMTSSDPHLRLKLDAEPYKDGLMSKMKDYESPDSSKMFSNAQLMKNILQPMSDSMNQILALPNVQKPWMSSLGSAFSKLTVGLGYPNSNQTGDEQAFFPSKAPLDDVEFRTYLDESGRLKRPEELRLRVYHGGVVPALRKVVWRLLLNIFPSNLTGEERMSYMKRKTEQYQQLRATWQARADDEHVKYISNMVWKDVLRTDRSHPFFEGNDDNPNTICLLNILTTFSLTHPKVSYCQGMSDLVSPIFVVLNNEAQAYVCFCGIMGRLQENFLRDGTSMSTKFKHLSLLVRHQDPEFFAYLQSLSADNMFFCYRWLLLEMKREFSFDDAITVLEVMWSSLPPQPPDIDLLLEDYTGLNNDKDQTFGSGCQDLKTGSPSPQTISTSTSEDTSNSCMDDFNSGLELGNGEDPPVELNNIVEIVDYATEDSIKNSPQRHRKKISHNTNSDNQAPLEPLPPPEEFGCGNPFLLFVCLAVLLEERDYLLAEQKEYDDFVMHFDRMVRSHCPKKVLSKAMRLFAEYLKSASIQTL